MQMQSHKSVPNYYQHTVNNPVLVYVKDKNQKRDYELTKAKFQNEFINSVHYYLQCLYYLLLSYYKYAIHLKII